MKTVELAAREYADISVDLVIDEEERYYKDFKAYDSFKAGSEFAQRWISVEEELPEEGDEVIAMEGEFKEVFFFYPRGMRDEQYLKGNFTHWRLVTLK